MHNASKIPLAGITKRALASGLPHLLLSIGFVQGLSYLSQFAVAIQLGPSDFGKARSVEALVSNAVALGTFGIPTLIIGFVAAAENDSLRGRLTARLLCMVALTSLIVAAGACVLGRWLVASDAQELLQVVIWVTVLIAVNRTALNYFQGARQLHRVAYINSALALAAFVILVVYVQIYGLMGWAFARYLGELMLLVVLIGGLWKILKFNGPLADRYSIAKILGAGQELTASQTMRVTMDNLGVFALGYVGSSAPEIGMYGLYLLVITALSVLPATVATVSIPRLVGGLGGNKAELKQRFYLLVKGMAFIAALTGVFLAVLSPWLDRLLSGRYGLSNAALLLLTLTVTARAIASQSAALLIASNKMRHTLAANFAVLCGAGASYPIAAKQFGLTGLAIATVVCESILALFFFATAKSTINHVAFPEPINAPNI